MSSGLSNPLWRLWMDKMSAAYQQQYPNTFPASMDFPNEFLEPSVSVTVGNQGITPVRTNPMFSPNTGWQFWLMLLMFLFISGYSSINSSLSSSRNRLACDDSGVCSNVDPSSSMQFLSSTLTSTVNDCMEQNSMNLSGNDLFDDLEPQPRSRCNTWPMQVRPSNNEYPSNNCTIQEGIQEEEELWVVFYNQLVNVLRKPNKVRATL